jgi:hypothetical protein
MSYNALCRKYFRLALTFFLSRNESFGQNWRGTPDHFILYGSTAIALRLGLCLAVSSRPN